MLYLSFSPVYHTSENTQNQLHLKITSNRCKNILLNNEFTMDALKKLIAGSLITLVVGGATYTFTQEDLTNNFANETGMTEEQASEYVSSVTEDQLDSWDVIGNEMKVEGDELVQLASEIDCVNYEYEWESPSLSCFEGKSQIDTLGRNYINLGNSYLRLGADTASDQEMIQTQQDIDALNQSLRFEVVSASYTQEDIEESINTNSYNKALLQSALDSN